MSKVKALALRVASRAISTVPNSVLPQVEMAARLGQGKGWGAATVELEVQAALSLLPASDRVKPVVLDVGANVGSWTAALLSLAPEATVFAFEPSQAAFSRLTDRFSDSPHVTVIQAAVGRANGVATLWADSAGSSLASLTRRRLNHFDIDFSHSEEVSVITLDSWRLDSGVIPTLLKIDVEGHELDVLAGASELLKSIKVVQFEFGGCNIDTRTFFQDFFYFFDEAGYVIHRLGPKGLLQVSRYAEIDEAFQTTNYFAKRT